MDVLPTFKIVVVVHSLYEVVFKNSKWLIYILKFTVEKFWIWNKMNFQDWENIKRAELLISKFSIFCIERKCDFSPQRKIAVCLIFKLHCALIFSWSVRQFPGLRFLGYEGSFFKMIVGHKFETPCRRKCQYSCCMVCVHNEDDHSVAERRLPWCTMVEITNKDGHSRPIFVPLQAHFRTILGPLWAHLGPF